MSNRILKTITGNYVVRNIMIIASLVIIIITLSFFFLDIYTRHGQKFIVPNLSGMSLEEAAKATESYNSRLEIIDSLFIPSQRAGVVLEQNPKPGSFIKENRRILLTVNTMNPKQIPLPYVAGYSLRQAKNRLISAGLEISKITYQQDIATNNVIAQRYGDQVVNADDGVMINVGQSVELVVGLADTTMKEMVPDLTGLTINEAKSKIWESGFNLKMVELNNDIEVATMNQALIYSQQPLSYNEILLGEEIIIWATLDHEQVAQTKEKLQKRDRQIKAIEQLMAGYRDTLRILQLEDGKNHIESVHGIVAPEDSVYYLNRIDMLQIEKNAYIKDINYTNDIKLNE